jgi:hypothetical protein
MGIVPVLYEVYMGKGGHHAKIKYPERMRKSGMKRLLKQECGNKSA